jgi:pimeloyl-ACP methyl ester carboxylesterase
VDFQEACYLSPLVNISYAEGPNNGPPFVVLHGGSARWQYSANLLEALELDWHVFAPDFRGHGKSGHVKARYLLRDYVADIASFLSEVVKDRAVIYGHSLGGEVAVMLAALHPGLPRAIIVGDAPLSHRNHATEVPSHRLQNELWYRVAGHPEDEIAEALREMLVPVVGQLELRKAREVFGEDSPWFAHQATSLYQLDPDMLAAVLAGPEIMLVGYEPETLLPKITCPVLLLQADATFGSALPDDEVDLARRLIPRVVHIKLSGIGHPLHGPPGGTRTVMAAIRPFLAGL